MSCSSGEPPPPATAGVLLAAGGSRRFRPERGDPAHKLLVSRRGRALWQHSLDHLLAAGFSHTLLVTGAAELHPIPAGVTVVENRRWADGQAGSLQIALAAAGTLGADHAVIGLADQPGVGPLAWRAVAGAPPSPIVVASYDGVRGPHPVRLRADVWPLLANTGDAGARQLISARPEWVTTVACIGSAFDIDTWEDLRGWKDC